MKRIGYELKFKHILIKFDIIEPGQVHIVLENCFKASKSEPDIMMIK